MWTSLGAKVATPAGEADDLQQGPLGILKGHVLVIPKKVGSTVKLKGKIGGCEGPQAYGAAWLPCGGQGSTFLCGPGSK